MSNYRTKRVPPDTARAITCVKDVKHDPATTISIVCIEKGDAGLLASPGDGFDIAIWWKDEGDDYWNLLPCSIGSFSEHFKYAESRTLVVDASGRNEEGGAHDWYVVEQSRNEFNELQWQIVAEGFTSEEDATTWKDNQLNDKHEWKFPTWMIPHCGTEYLQDVKTVIWRMNDKTPVQVNAPLALISAHTDGEVRMLTKLHDKGMLCPPWFMKRLEEAE